MCAETEALLLKNMPLTEPVQDTIAEEDTSQKQRRGFRYWSTRIATHPDFELTIIFFIFCNVVTLALFNPLQPDTSPWNDVLGKLGKLFILLYLS